MDNEALGTDRDGRSRKPATAARMYDYYLGGVHNFPADREVAEKVIAIQPLFPAIARANRAFLRRAVSHLADVGVRQFLDLGSGMPTAGNVHEIAQQIAPEARVVYVDIDPVAVAESVEILEGNDRATAVYGDLRQPQAVLDHPQVRNMLDFDQPIGLLLAAVLHFVPDDKEAYDIVTQLVAALAPGSYLAISHASIEAFAASSIQVGPINELYRRQTATPVAQRTHDKVEKFFTGTELVEPGIVWAPEWRPSPHDPKDFADDPRLSCQWAGVGILP